MIDEKSEKLARDTLHLIADKCKPADVWMLALVCALIIKDQKNYGIEL